MIGGDLRTISSNCTWQLIIFFILEKLTITQYKEDTGVNEKATDCCLFTKEANARFLSSLIAFRIFFQ